ncbi:hypothetical protein PhCBS80983_g00912 [Powellomyces hirtus]|uniref:Pet127-domain-containing protein n=1 Tax=Powellomyces hirtus TaxID=109895 RepID=A0A507EC79_9FUNG|nr:hypothetical protein PhCBS80983_g00912 [Powellomyces hirtus]
MVTKAQGIEEEQGTHPIGQMDGTTSSQRLPPCHMRRTRSGRIRSCVKGLSETEPLKEELVPRLAHGLDSVLFESEPQFLKDPSTGAYNFDPWLKNICQPEDFDYDVLPAYMIASEDKALLDAARKHDKKYVSSTSSFTGILAKMYLLISHHKPIDKSSFSASFETQPSFLTSSSRAPTSVILRHVNGTYAIDSEKSNKEWNILQILGKSMEKMLTAAPEEFDLCRKENSHKLTEEMKDKDYHRFAKVEQFLLRAQIDCYHPDLPHKTFDLKTRATLAVRMNPATCKENLDYKLNLLRGDILSFEREDFDMLRSAMLKYSFQVRIGGMDGVFVCYHNTDEVFGFQYLPLTKMDQQLFGNSLFAQQAFALSVKVCQMVFDRVTKDFPGQSLRITIGQQKPIFQFEPLAILVDPITELNTAIDSPPSPNLTQYDLSCISRINRSYVTPTITSPADEWSLDCTFHKANVSRGSLLRTYKYMRENAANLGLQENNTNQRFINEVREMAGLPKHQRQSTITASPEDEKLRD